MTTVSATTAVSPPRAARARRIAAWTVFLVAAFAYRLGYGLCSEFFFEDETQIFLIGLRHHATGAWPYFGADIVWTHSQIPGALQGLLVGLPMDLFPVPEAPFVLLNLLSLAGLALMAWYICRRLPELPRWLVWGWLLFIPWTLAFGTHVINPSYELVGAAVFFVGFFEAWARSSARIIPSPLAFAMMGAAIFWIMQIHMSWPLLGPFVLVAFVETAFDAGPAVVQDRHGYREAGARRRALKALTGFLAGSASTASVLVPTFWTYGLSGGAGGTYRNLVIHAEPPMTLVTTLARMFSFASLEIVRFLGLDTARRLAFLLDHAWLIPFAVVALTAGIAQPVWMTWSWFKRRSAHSEWTAIRWAIAASIVLIYISYWFVLEPPQAHAFYVLAPLAFVYAFYCWSFIDSPRSRRVAALLLATIIVYQAGMVVGRAPERSLYKNRQVAADAVFFRTPDMLGHRRPFAVEGAPPPQVFVATPALSEVRLEKATWARGALDMLFWTITIRNESRDRAYRDMYVEVIYEGDGGWRDVRYDLLPEILQPGESITVAKVNHGFIHPFTTATVHLLKAERLLPLRTTR